MIPVYICDDEAPIRQRLEQIVAGQIMILDSDMGPVRTVEEPDELLRLQKEDSVPAVYFLDIDFPGKISGLELAQKLRQYDPRGFIVFITAHHDLAFETFRLRLEALDYIVKGDAASMPTRVQSLDRAATVRSRFSILCAISPLKVSSIWRRWATVMPYGYIWTRNCWNSTAAWTTLPLS